MPLCFFISEQVALTRFNTIYYDKVNSVYVGLYATVASVDLDNEER